MTPERFHQIVEAYGADPRRWPLHERAAGQAWAQLHRAEADACLAEAAGLDAWLAADHVAPPDAALQQRIISGAPVRRRPAMQRRAWWWSGAAVAGVGLLGGLAGAVAVSFFVLTEAVPPVHESSYLTSSFGGSSADWSSE
ncbi:hypothetical protein [Paraburkholderia rhynchosiae]|uniref:Anti-sigma factor n=1 Tax=Paraburkholderia rhynchosiae TaxID=487049 RepID=A0A2N7WBZ0_9BURK|nr:hypothetical protein [Paraburkholderia rhynchosiae]PMS26932.1 hypothetical protein C0Z16_26050 [Paraburkholderia rhynchosiae]CAB3727175.1 hypothetical protein LMG27174_05470 [Paraburkholderia rhynchosiae]